MRANIKRGKAILLVIACIILTLDATMTTLVTLKFGLYRLPHGIIRFCVTSTFMYFIYKGKRGIKNVFVGLLLYAIVSTLMSYSTAILFSPLMLVTLIIYFVSVVLLMFSKDVRSVFEDEVSSNQGNVEIDN